MPWIGRKAGRAGVAECSTQLRERTQAKHVEIDTIIGDDDRAVILGGLRTEVLATG